MDQIENMIVRPYHTEAEAWDALFHDEASSCHSDSRPVFLYRGQASRHQRSWPPSDHAPFTAGEFTFESIIPTYYRGVENAVADVAAGRLSEVPESYQEKAAFFRSVMTWACIYEHAMTLPKHDSDVILSWLQTCAALPDGQQFDAPGSVGQHYGFHTAYLDATSCLRVAFWFATRDFDTGAYLRAGDSVIYRIRLSTLQDCCNRLNRVNAWTGRDALRFVDIRDTPAQLGQRACNQAGWSLINFQYPILLNDLIVNSGIDAYIFPRGAVPSTENNLERDFIAPPNESLSDIFDDVLSGNLYSAVRHGQVDHFIGSIDLHDPTYVGWLIH